MFVDPGFRSAELGLRLFFALRQSITPSLRATYPTNRVAPRRLRHRAISCVKHNRALGGKIGVKWQEVTKIVDKQRKVAKILYLYLHPNDCLGVS